VPPGVRCISAKTDNPNNLLVLEGLQYRIFARRLWHNFHSHCWFTRSMKMARELTSPQTVPFFFAVDVQYYPDSREALHPGPPTPTHPRISWYGGYSVYRGGNLTPPAWDLKTPVTCSSHFAPLRNKNKLGLDPSSQAPSHAMPETKSLSQ